MTLRLEQEFGGGEDGDGQTVYVYDATQELNDLGILVMRMGMLWNAWIGLGCDAFRQHTAIAAIVYRCPLTGKNVNPFTTVVSALTCHVGSDARKTQAIKYHQIISAMTVRVRTIYMTSN